MQMKYILLLFFLIALVNSKFPKLGFKSLLEQLNSGKDEDLCVNAGPDKDKCQAVSLTDKNAQCCLFIFEYNDEDPEETCSIAPKSLNDYKNLYNAKQFKALTKEVIGYVKYGASDEEKQIIPLDEIDIKGEIKCKNEYISISIGKDTYTEEDIKTLTSEDYCLNYTVTSAMSGFKRGFDCQKGKVLKSSKDVGIECGTVSLNFKIGNVESKYKTCMLFSYDYFSKIKIPSMFIDKINEEMDQIMPGTIHFFSRIVRFKRTYSYL